MRRYTFNARASINADSAEDAETLVTELLADLYVEDGCGIHLHVEIVPDQVPLVTEMEDEATSDSQDSG